MNILGVILICIMGTWIIPLTQGKVAVVDAEDWGTLVSHKWHIRGRYAARWAVVGGSRTSIAMHRAIMNPPSHLVVDHINGNPLDNRRRNLRVCTVADNNANSAVKKRQDFHGVREQGKYFITYLHYRGKCHTCGVYADQESAARAYDQAALYMWGWQAERKLNFPESRLAVPTAPVVLRKAAIMNFPRPRSSTGFVGVVPNGDAFLSAICVGKRNITLGRFPTAEEAARQHDSVVKFLNLPLQLNFPNDATIQAASVEEVRSKAKGVAWQRPLKCWGNNGYRGVHFVRNRYRAGIWAGGPRGKGRSYYLGAYKTAEEAARAYDDAARRLHGAAARLNFKTQSA